MSEKSIVMTCSNAGDEFRHQQEPVPRSVVEEYERKGRPWTCYLCVMRRLAASGSATVDTEAERIRLFDKWGRDYLPGEVPEVQE